MTDHHQALGGHPQVALAELSEAPLSIDDVVAAVRSDRAGAVALFVGMVRDHDHGSSVAALDYSAHPSAAAVAHDVAARHADTAGILRLAVVHRVGSLQIGDLAIVAAVSAEHRAEAFEVCRALVDAVKAEVPIWKHQHFTDGADEWVGIA